MFHTLSCHHTHIFWAFSPHRFYLVHWCQPHRPILSGGIDTLRTVFTCLLYSLEAIKPRGFLFSRSCFVYRVFTAVTQDLLSHLSKNYLLNEYFAKYLCLYAQDAHARPLIWNTSLVHPFWQTNKACKLTSVILPSATCRLILWSLHHKPKAELHHMGCNPSEITPHSINFIKNRPSVWHNSIYSFQLATPSG